jgi:GNAT superfamily N-acetyltransferase
MLLRRAVPGDETAVAGVHVRSWQAAYRGLLPDEYLDGLQPEDRAARYTFGDPNPDRVETVIAVEEAIVRGFATIGPSRDSDLHGSGELFAIYVDPAAWRRGIGRALMTDARDRLTVHGFTEGLLWVLVGNERAERFYPVDGWLRDGSRRLQEVHGVMVDEVRYRRALP